MTQSEKAVIDQQEKTEAGASGNDLGAPFSLWAPAKGALTHHQPGAGGGTACGSRAPSGGGSAGVVLPCPVIPADTNGGLCIGRSCADALGGLGAIGHQQASAGYIPAHCLLLLSAPTSKG